MRAAFALLLICAMPAGAADAPAAAAGADLFTNGTVHHIRITMPAPSLAVLRTNARTYVAASVLEGTNVLTNVAIHLKGSSGSFRRVDDKPGLTLDFSRLGSPGRFHGLSKIHLNNSVEDPTYLHELIGSEAFTRAGIPAARVAHAQVELNGRKLGLYVLKEGFTTEFLARHFLHPTGSFYEPEPGRDVDDTLDVQLGPLDAARALEALADAAQEPDMSRRWERLGRTLDVDRFLTFMAMEILIGHRDGYCLSRNNFRVYHDVDSGRMMFIPHGMDQLFGYARMPIQPRMSGLVARGIMEMPEGRQHFRNRCRELLTNVLVLSNLTARVDETLANLQRALPADHAMSLGREMAALKQRIAERLKSVDQQLRQAPLELLTFRDGVASLPNWQPTDIPEGGRLVRTNTADGKRLLSIKAGPVTFASWRSKVILAPGKYRFDGRLRTTGVLPLPFGKNHGATVRVTNARTSPIPRWTGTVPWQQASATFEITAPDEEIELVCELRASKGEADFDLDSLLLTRLR
jgi:spore coat protein H